MNIFELIDQMNEFIEKRDWTGLVRKHKFLCNTYGGSKIENDISAIDSGAYELQIKYCFNQAVSKAIEGDALAIYFEYDLDNLWASAFYICKEYTTYARSLDIGDDWACNYEVPLTIDGPNFEEFSNQYEMSPSFGNDDVSIVTNTYLIARTIAAFGRIVDSIDTQNLNICIAFHDQDPIMRIREIKLGS